MFVFRKIWRPLFSSNIHFEIRPFSLLPTIYENIWPIFLKKYVMYEMPNIKTMQQDDITSPKISYHTARSLTNVTTLYMKITILQDPLQMSPHHIWRWPYCKIPYKCHHTIYADDHTARSLTNVTTPYMKMTIPQDPLQMSPHHICRWPYCKIP